MITYLPNYPDTNLQYSLSYQDLKDQYHRFKSMTDAEFLEDIKDVLHFAVFVTWFKETAAHANADGGIVHELVHFLIFSEHENIPIKELRDLFARTCALC